MSYIFDIPRSSIDLGDVDFRFEDLQLIIHYKYLIDGQDIETGEIFFNWCHEFQMLDYYVHFKNHNILFDRIKLGESKEFKGQKFKKYSLILSGTDKIFLVYAKSVEFRARH